MTAFAVTRQVEPVMRTLDSPIAYGRYFAHWSKASGQWNWFPIPMLHWDVADRAADLPVAGSRFGSANPSIIIVGDAKLFADRLRQRHSQVEIIPVEQLDLSTSSLRRER
jgi:hypothetical protein